MISQDWFYTPLLTKVFIPFWNRTSLFRGQEAMVWQKVHKTFLCPAIFQNVYSHYFYSNERGGPRLLVLSLYFRVCLHLWRGKFTENSNSLPVKDVKALPEFKFFWPSRSISAFSCRPGSLPPLQAQPPSPSLPPSFPLLFLCVYVYIHGFQATSQVEIPRKISSEEDIIITKC